MKVDEAMYRLMTNENNLWARPISWMGNGQAVCMDKERGLLVVPSGKGGYSWHPDPGDLIDKWEVLTPDEFYESEKS